MCNFSEIAVFKLYVNINYEKYYTSYISSIILY